MEFKMETSIDDKGHEVFGELQELMWSQQNKIYEILKAGNRSMMCRYPDNYAGIERLKDGTILLKLTSFFFGELAPSRNIVSGAWYFKGKEKDCFNKAKDEILSWTNKDKVSRMLVNSIEK